MHVRNENTFGWGKAILGSLLYLIITATVAAILFTDYVFDLRIGTAGVFIEPTAYVVILLFLAYWCQVWLSASAGGKRALETLVSVTMLALIGMTLAVWYNVPLVALILKKVSALVGYPIVSTPSNYKVTVMVMFGILAILDLLNDLTGIGRRSNSPAYVRSEVQGATLQQAPHQPMEFASESGNPQASVKGRLRVEFTEVEYVLPNGKSIITPFNDRTMKMVEFNLTGRTNAAPNAAITSAQQTGGTDDR